MEEIIKIQVNAAYIIYVEESPCLHYPEMVVVFVLEEKITLGSYTDGFEITLNGQIRYKSAKETSSFGNE